MNNKIPMILIALTTLLTGCNAATNMENSDQVYWLITATVKDGQLANLKAMNKEMVAATQKNEAHTLGYDWSLSDDNKTCYFYERYADSDAVMIHLKTFDEKFVKRLMATIDVDSFIVFGKPNTEVKKALEGFGANFHKTIGGFEK